MTAFKTLLPASGFSAHYIYDLECLPNFFSLRATRWEDGAKWCYEVSDWKNDGQALYVFLEQIRLSNGRMVGYNNTKYDYPMIHMIMQYQGHVNNALLYNKSQTIIQASRNNDWSEHIWDDQVLIPQIDLMAIHHFDNKAKLTSLKLLQFNMMLNDIVEFEHDWSKPVTREQADQTLVYNDNDVFSTGKFFEHSMKAIEFRDQLTKKYGKNFTNHNDTKIGQDFFVMELAKHGVKANKYNQTHRTSINLREVILPYIQFETPAFQEILEFFRGTMINPEQIKGFFGSRSESDTKCTANVTERLAAAMDPNDVVVHYVDGSKSKLTERDLTKPVKYLRPINIHAVVNGFRFDFGAGGIHGSLHNTVVTPKKGYTLRDSDVASYYPNLSISNNFFPKHLGEIFCRVYLDIYEQRKTYKKGSAENNMLKLALNGVYGKSNDKHSPFYDPQYTMAITINGQLLLCMLAEQLMKIPELQLVQINTDGLTYVCPDQYLPHANAINDWWQKLTKLELEHVDYLKMAIRDVNNYLAVTNPYTDKTGKLVPPKIKRIGAYAYERASENDGTRELPWYKNQGGVVIAKAAEAALVRGDNIERFIREHLKTNPLDFMMRTKVNRSDELYLESNAPYEQHPLAYTEYTPEELKAMADHNKKRNTEQLHRIKLQRVSRYFVSNNGGYLIKEMNPTADQIKEWHVKPHWRHKVSGETKQATKAPSGMWLQCPPPSQVPPQRRIGIEAGSKVTVCNSLTGLDMSDVNIAYYVAEARKLVDPLLT